MIAIAIIASILGMLILSHWWENYQQRALHQQAVDAQLLDDNILTYHLDWDVLQTEEFRLIHFVKKVNATRRYAELTGVSRAQAWQAIDDINSHTKRKIRKLDDVLDNEQNTIRRLLDSGDTETAVSRLSDTMGVDKFTAQEAIAYIQQALTEQE